MNINPIRNRLENLGGIIYRFAFADFCFPTGQLSLEVVARRWSTKKGVIEKETLAQVFSCEFCEIFKNTIFYRTPLITASVSLEEYHVSTRNGRLHALLFISNTLFMTNTMLKFAKKIKRKLSKTLSLNFCSLKTSCYLILSSSMLSSKTIMIYSKASFTLIYILMVYILIYTFNI